MNHTEDDRSVKRRHVLRAAGVGILAGMALAPPATAAPKRGAELTDQEIALVLQVARLGAVYPVPFPDFGEAGPAASRAVAERLRARLPELGAGRLQLIRDGARDLVAAGLTGAGAGGADGAGRGDRVQELQPQ
ncbi:hypothetical protein [Nonomuraea sp. NPDC049158]|uniref:hypothetical protein n=1 Tax=Nonomuraea sp. NPDC049158 TaxID=3155649 RepID=UPI0033E631A2